MSRLIVEGNRSRAHEEPLSRLAWSRDNDVTSWQLFKQNVRLPKTEDFESFLCVCYPCLYLRQKQNKATFRKHVADDRVFGVIV